MTHRSGAPRPGLPCWLGREDREANRSSPDDDDPSVAAGAALPLERLPAAPWSGGPLSLAEPLASVAAADDLDGGSDEMLPLRLSVSDVDKKD